MMKKVASVVILLIMMSISGAVCYCYMGKLANTVSISMSKLPAGHK
jgi:hypothetical protein